MTAGRTEIYYNRKKRFKVLGISLLFVAIGCWLVLNPKKTFTYHFIPIPTVLLGTILIIFFGFAGIFMIRRFADPSPAFIIDDLGIEDRSGPMAAGFILWKDINAVSLRTVKQQRFIMIEVKDPDKYLRDKSTVMQFFHRFNQKIFKGQFSISAQNLDISVDELYQIIRKNVFIHNNPNAPL